MAMTNLTMMTSASSEGSSAWANNGSGRLDNVFENPFDQTPVRITFIVLYSVVFAMCFLGNIVVLVVFAYSKRMRTRTNLFLANLAVADFCVGVFCVLPNLSINLSPFWRLGRVMCKLYFFVNYLAYTASILLLVVIAAERYIAIMHPLRSRGYFTAARLFVAQVTVWVVAAVYNVPILLMFDTTSTPAGAFCYITLPLMNLTAYYTAHFVLWYLLPLTVILIMYGRISCTLWATSAIATPITRHDVRGSSVGNIILQDVKKYPPGNGGGVVSKCCTPTSVGNQCLSYCETIGQASFRSMVTIGVLSADGATHVCHGGLNGTEVKKNESRAVFNNKPPDNEEDCRGSRRRSGTDSRKNSQRPQVPLKRKVNGQLEMVSDKWCGSCFNCIHKNVPKTAPRQYSPGLDYARYQHQNQHNKRAILKQHRNSEDCAYELSDVPSSDDYDTSRSRAEAVNGLTAVYGDKLERNGNGGDCVLPRRLRTHCRISSPRGLMSRRRVIRLLVAVVAIFAICVLPFHLRNLLHYWNVNESPGGIFDFLSPISSVLMYLNCGLNPVIYWMFSDHFCRSLKDTLCFWKRSKRSSSRLMLNSPRQLKNSLLKR